MIKHKTLGYTIIETMIAIVISLVLMGGILEVFINARRLYNQESEFAQLQEKSRFLEDYLLRVMRLAGYRSPPATGLFSSINAVYNAATPYVSGASNTGTNNSDTLIIRYQGSGNGAGTADGTIRDCLNRAIDANVMATNTLSLTANNELQCQASNASASPNNSTQILLNGVENFQVLYGEDVNGDGSADRYVPSDFPYLSMNNVVSMRVAFLLRSNEQVKVTPTTTTYNLLGTGYTTPSDRYLRQQISFTVGFRNIIEKPF